MKRLYVQFLYKRYTPVFQNHFSLRTVSNVYYILSLSNYKTKLFELLFQINCEIPDNRTIAVNVDLASKDIFCWKKIPYHFIVLYETFVYKRSLHFVSFRTKSWLSEFRFSLFVIIHEMLNSSICWIRRKSDNRLSINSAFCLNSRSCCSNHDIKFSRFA